MRKNLLEEEPHIAKEFKIGNTRVRIATNYCEDKTPEQVQEILDRIAFKVQPFVVAAELEKQKSENLNAM